MSEYEVVTVTRDDAVIIHSALREKLAFNEKIRDLLNLKRSHNTLPLWQEKILEKYFKKSITSEDAEDQYMSYVCEVDHIQELVDKFDPDFMGY